tara:strand:+ start:198 stop:677 length:480 start_codon:yes stop_codon:yes gene_type:complete
LAKKLENMLNEITLRDTFVALGSEMKDSLIKRTQEGKDVFNEPFKKYSKGYFNRKKLGNYYPRQATQFAPNKREDVNLTLTSDMLNSMTIKDVDNKSVTIGFTGDSAIKANHNEFMGRVMSSTKKPISDEEEKMLNKFFNDKITKAFKETSGTTTVKIG